MSDVARGVMIGVGQAIVTAVAGVHTTIVSSWVWQAIFMPYGFFPLGIFWVVLSMLMFYRIHSWWNSLRGKMMRSAVKESGVTTAFPTAPALVPSQPAQTTPISPVLPEPEKKNQT